MTIQFTTDLNKTIRWTENEAEAVLRNFIAADKSTHWIHTDLTVEQTNIVSKIVWTILSILPSIRNWLFDVNLDASLNVLHLLKTQIQDENADLKALFNQAVDHFAELSPKRFNPETTSKKNFYIESSILSGLNPATSLARPDFSISLSAIYNPLINDLDLQESSEDSDAPLASTPAVEVPYYKSFELNGSKIFLRACDKTLSNDITTIRFQRSRKDTITLLNQGDLQIIEASVPNQNSYKVHKGDELVESFKKSLSDSIGTSLAKAKELKKRTINIQLTNTTIDRLNIDNSANCYANAIASFLEHNPQAFDQVYLSLKSTRQKTLKVFEDTLAKVLA